MCGIIELVSEKDSGSSSSDARIITSCLAVTMVFLGGGAIEINQIIKMIAGDEVNGVMCVGPIVLVSIALWALNRDGKQEQP